MTKRNPPKGSGCPYPKGDTSKLSVFGCDFTYCVRSVKEHSLKDLFGKMLDVDCFRYVGCRGRKGIQVEKGL